MLNTLLVVSHLILDYIELLLKSLSFAVEARSSRVNYNIREHRCSLSQNPYSETATRNNVLHL